MFVVVSVAATAVSCVCMLAATSCKRHYLIHAERHLSRTYIFYYFVLEAVRCVEKEISYTFFI